MKMLLPADRRFERAGAVILLVAAILFGIIFTGQEDAMSIANLCLVYGLVTVTLNLLIGYGGQISLGHAGLLAIGAYTSTILANDYALPVPIDILAAATVTAVVGLVLGLPTGRLRGHYLAIATLGFGLAIPQIATNWNQLTGGFEGLTVPPPQIAGITFDTQSALYWPILIVVALCILAILSLLGTSSGRSFMAIRDSEDAALAMGINVFRTKVILFTTSAFFAGIAGALFSYQAGVVAPGSFPFLLSLFFLAAVILGGLASVWGSLIGAVVLVLVQEQASNSNGLSTAIIGAVVVVVILVAPSGLVAIPRRVRQMLTSTSRETPGPERVVKEAPRGT
jgi:branched-chain amino acid transport system permease protein